MFRKILIANRGEIALRVIRACRELGVPSISIYSTADREAPHVRFADESVCVGPAPSRQSYLNTPVILSAARVAGADAIHPGYGFLSENAEFAEACEACGIAFIGPTADMMRRLGDKVRAREAAAAAGVPILPGSGPIEDAALAEAEARAIGYPILVKAAAGGGGRGMKVAAAPAELAEALALARSEAQASFKDGTVFLERYLTAPRHVEVQVLADRYGRAIHLFERECSIQRRHQKVLEEAPSPAVDLELRERMGRTALSAIAAVGYRGAGTIEFLLEPGGEFFFLEMNTRIQVEHPVTEAVTGVDLVAAQILVAAGEPLPHRQEDIGLHGAAIECRVCAEDWERHVPSAGRIEAYHEPGGAGVRVDSGVFGGLEVSPHYDAMIAKVIAWGLDRPQAIRRMSRACLEYLVEGVQTNLPLHLRILRDADFLAGRYDTGYLDRLLASKRGK